MKPTHAFLLSILLTTTLHSAEKAGKFAWKGSLKSIDNTILSVPRGTVAMSEYVYVSNTLTQLTTKDPCSIMFVIDNSSSNGETDNAGQRFKSTVDLIDEIYKKAPETKVGLIFFGNTLWFNKADDPTVFTALNGGTGSTEAYIPPLDLDKIYNGRYRRSDNWGTSIKEQLNYSKKGIEVLKMYLETIANYNTVVGGQVSKYWPYDNLSPNLHGGLTNITQAFEAAKQAHLNQTPKLLKNRHFNIFFSDGYATVGGDGYVTGSDVPATFTVFYNANAADLAKLQTMTDNIKNNNYSTRNKDVTTLVNLTNWTTIKDKLKDLFGKILSSTTGIPLEITVGTSTSSMWDNTGFKYKDMFPLQIGQTPFSLDIKVHLKKDSLNDLGQIVSTIEKDTALKYAFKVAVAADTVVPDSMKLIWWGRDLALFYLNDTVQAASSTMKNVQLRFWEYKLDTLYGYKLINMVVMSKVLGDRDTCQLLPATGHLYCDFQLQASATSTRNDKILQLAKSDSIILLLRNPYLPLDTLRKAIPFFDQSKVATPVSIPPGGTTFSSLSTGLTVTLSTATVGATICYTLNGADPDSTCSNGTIYTGVGIAITQNTTLKARAVLTGWIPSDILIAVYTKVDPGRVATPVAIPPGQTFLNPLSVLLSTATVGATICYTVNGVDLDSTCSNATVYTGVPPINIAVTTTLKARAVKSGMYPSGIMVEVYTYLPPISITKAWYLDQNRDGRVETAFLDFDKVPPQLPDSLTFLITGHGGRSANVTATKARGEISGNGTRLRVNLATPLTFGVTSVTNSPTSGLRYRQDNIPFAAGNFAVEDSITPVLISGEVFSRTPTEPLKRVSLLYSEPVNFPLTSQTAVIFKRDATEIASGQVKIASIVKLNDTQYDFHVASNSTFFPIVGDSAAIVLGGETKDLLGNFPTSKLFRVLGGIVPPPEAAKIYVTFASGTMDPNFISAEPVATDKALFIPVLPNGKAMEGTMDGKCGSCFAGKNGSFVGSVIHMEIPGATSYEFKIFSTLGEYMAGGKGRITESDLSLLESLNEGARYHARIVWTGKTSKEDRAGNGAYILVAKLEIAKDLKTGAPVSHQSKKILFGFMRGK